MTRTFTLILACALIASCAPKSRFEWGNYESSLYGYYRNDDLRDRYRASLERAIAKGEKSGRLAPGLLAERGYLAMEDGDIVLAVSYFEREKRAFPESAPFMTSIINKLNGQSEDDGVPVS